MLTMPKYYLYSVWQDWAKFRPLGYFFLWAVFVKSSRQFGVTLNPRLRLCYNFEKNRVLHWDELNWPNSINTINRSLCYVNCAKQILLLPGIIWNLKSAQITAFFLHLQCNQN
jgi:hypothetical protein